jgi:monoterpene epsilon-lactone hydrolase
MSVRLRLLTRVLRWVVRPALRWTPGPDRARRNFNRAARLLRVPPYLLHLVESGMVPLHWVSVRRRRDDWVVLYLHGGGYVAGSPVTHIGLAGRIARLTGLQVVMPEYRLAPEHPAPAAFDDALVAHAALLGKGYAAARIILAGDSAGGGLALALMADLCGRGLAPAGLFAFSPWTDLGMTGDSLRSNAACDPLFPVARLPELVGMVLGSADPLDPRVSPLYARFDRPPRVLLQVGSTEILRDDSTRIVEVLRQAGGVAEVAVWPDCPHGWQLLDGYLPEARAALRDVADFVSEIVSVRSLNLQPDGN